MSSVSSSSKPASKKGSKKSIFDNSNTQFDFRVVLNVALLRQQILQQCQNNLPYHHNTLSRNIESCLYVSLRASVGTQLEMDRHYVCHPYICSEYMNRLLSSDAESSSNSFYGALSEIIEENIDNETKEFVQFLCLVAPVVNPVVDINYIMGYIRGC